jgi:endoglycosylceramidase
MGRTRALASLLGSLFLLAGTSGSALATQSGPLLRHEGRWIVDNWGRVVILHGVNNVYKFAPYTPAAGGFGADDAQYLASQGFNVLRTGLIYKGLEPTIGVYDDNYLAQIANTVNVSAQSGLYTLLDFHQDMYNEVFAGEGFPDWAVQTDGKPTQPSYGFPGNYLLMPALWTALGHFYDDSQAGDGKTLQDHYAAAWNHVAAYFKSQNMIVGYDLFNEPWPGPGPEWVVCVLPKGCKNVDQKTLTPMYSKVIKDLRKADKRHIVFYEPLPLFDSGAATYVSSGGDKNAAMSWHLYCLIPTSPLCPTQEETIFGHADQQAQTTGDALLMSEFGATDDNTVIEREVEEAEAHQQGWIYWAWGGSDPTTSGGSSQSVIIDQFLPPSDDNLKQDKLDVLARPFPHAIAGTPQNFGFNPTSKVFTLTYTTARVDGHGNFSGAAQTQIFLPARHYPNGYTVTINGGHALKSSDPTVLTVLADAAQVQVTVQPK